MMNNTKKNEVSVDEYRLMSAFRNLRARLRMEKYADRMERQLAYWALPSDRRLPLAFLGRSLGEILDTPFEELMATSGVGQKKIAALTMLLARATKDTPPEDPYGVSKPPRGRSRRSRKSRRASFDPTIVSEALWSLWRETVNRHELGQLKLGRVAPTLEKLPTVIWHTPLEEYMNLSLAEIRQLKTHGEKRVRAVMEVFWLVHETLADSSQQNCLDVDLVPKFVRPLERWIATQLSAPNVPSERELRNELIGPLLDQTKHDVGPTVWRLACGRLGVGGSVQTVRHQAKQMGVTRARVYQLLEDCSKVMAVRWPEGEHLLAALADRLRSVRPESDGEQLLYVAMDLFYPSTDESVRIVASRLRSEPSLASLHNSVAGAGEAI
ncbi:MAG: hypothetical protein ACC645_05560 [Pirellulales bacterium]